jgi:putative cardiolipin synthase
MTQTNFSAKAILVPCAFVLLAFFMQACGGDSAPVSEEEAQPTNHCTNIKRDSNTSLAAELAPFTDKMKDSTGVYVLEDGGGSMVTRAWLSEYAEETIDIQYFIFSTDNVGLIACDYLVRAADRGVKVRIIVDDIMVDAEFEDILTMDAHENISIQIYNPGMNLGKSAVEKATKLLTDFRSANQRMHNKTFIVDQQVVITGGRNIADEYFDYDHEFNFRNRLNRFGEVNLRCQLLIWPEKKRPCIMKACLICCMNMHVIQLTFGHRCAPRLSTCQQPLTR